MGKRSIYDILVDPSAPDFDSLIGFDAGFNERADVMVQAADGTDLNEMWREIAATLELRNQQRNRIIDFFTYKTDKIIETVGQPGTTDFEEASEYGQPVSIRGGKKLYRGYDFKFYDLAIRYTWMFLAEADRAQLENLNNMALEADNRLLFNKVLKTVFNPTNVSGIADSNIPTTVFKFFNGDGEVPLPYKTNTFSGSHTHYVTSGGSTITSANIDAIATDLKSHGNGVENGTKLVLWVNTQESAVIRTFKVATGASYDFIPSEGVGGGVLIGPGTIVGRPDDSVPGQIGTYGPFHIVEELFIPAGYVVGLATGGVDNLQNPIGIREHANPVYRGLKLIPGQRSDYPLVDSFYRRGFGTGVRQRGSGYVMQVTSSGTYTTPSLYV